MKYTREYTAQAGHPDEVALRAFLREGLRAEETEQILLHLDKCAACEQRLEEFEPLLRLCREQRIADLPKSPAWRDLSSAMDAIDRKRRSRVPKPAWMGAVAAGAAICAFLLWPSSRQAELRAETLLRQAERSAPIKGSKNRLEVRSAAGSFVRPAVLKGNRATDALGTRFAAAHYEWDDPLRPASYAKWRDRLKTKKVTVVEKGGQARIETDTSESDLVAASLTISENDMTVIGGRFEFADRQWVEITAIPDAVETPASFASFSPRERAPAPSGRSVQTLPERELHVWTTLDQLGLSVGAPVSVELGIGDRIQVIAYRLESDQERQLRSDLSVIEGVTLEVPTADDSGVPASSKAVDPAINTSESILARAHFLDRLASRFPTSTEAALSLPDRKTLWEMRASNASLMNQDIEILGNKLAKIGRVSPPGALTTTPSIRSLLESATIVDRLVTGMFATVSSDPPWDRLKEEFPRLRQASLEYARSLGEEPSR